MLSAPTALAQASLDKTTPRIAINQEAKDTATRLELLQQEIYSLQQDVMFTTLLQAIAAEMWPGVPVIPAISTGATSVAQDAGSLRRNATRQYFYDAYDGRELGRYEPASLPALNPHTTGSSRSTPAGRGDGRGASSCSPPACRSCSLP